MDHLTLPYPALGRIPFVGRSDTLRLIDEIVGNAPDRPTIIFIEGHGGIGKTEVIKKVLQHYADSRHDWHVARNVVDMYHPDVRTQLGFSDQIVKVLPEHTSSHFQKFHYSRKSYRSQTLSGSGSTDNVPLDDVIDDFKTCLRNITQQTHVLIAVDTAEKLTEALSTGSSAHRAASTDQCSWFCDLLEPATKIVVLVAGRPEVRRLSDAVSKRSHFNCQRITIGPFSPEECQDYITGVCSYLRECGHQNEVRYLEDFISKRGQDAYAMTDGDPISLALMVDLIAWENYKFPDNSDERSSVYATRREELQKYYILRLRDTWLGETINTLSYLQRGCTPELFAYMSEISVDAAAERLKKIEHLSIVKVREDIAEEDQSDQHGLGEPAKRYYLHDEVYRMMRRWVHNDPSEAYERSVNHESARRFCDNELQSIQGTLLREYSTLHEQYLGVLTLHETDVQPHFDRIAEANELKHNLLVDALYYALQQNPDRGLKRYCRYTLDAIQVGNVTLDRELESALVEILVDPTNNDILSADSNYSRVAEDMRKIWGCVRLWVEEHYKELIVRIDQLMPNEYTNYAAVLDIWRAYAHIYLGRHDEALQLLEKSISQLGQTAPEQSLNLAEQALETWYAAVMSALGLRVKGYLLRSTGKLRSSLPAYLQSIRLYDEADFQVELAVALNDYGLIQTDLGRLETGRKVVERGLDIRRQFGSPSHVAYSLNTLALVDIADEKPEIAIREAEQARIVFRRLGFDRGEGLALLTLAEAHREMAKAELKAEKYDDCERHLTEAVRCAEQARTIFEKTKEQSRIVQAYMEIGRANREMVRIKRELKATDQEVEGFAQGSEKALGEAAIRAKDVSLRWQIDAWVNTAWLGNYAKNEDLLIRAVSKAQELIKDQYGDYLIDSPREPKGKPSIVLENSEMWVWEQIGKLFMARADWYFTRHSESGTNDNALLLRSAIEDYAYALEHNDYGRSAESYHSKRAKDRLASRVAELPRNERRRVDELLKEWEVEFLAPLEQSVMRQYLEQNALL